MPDTVGITTVKRRGQQRRFGYVTWASLLDEGNPVFSKIVVRAVVCTDERLAAKQTHRQVVRTRLQLDLSVVQAHAEWIRLVAVRPNYVQRIRHVAPALGVLRHKREVVTDQFESWLIFFFDVAENRVG